MTNLPELAVLAGDAAVYIATHLVHEQLLVDTDRDGYRLALELGDAAGGYAQGSVRQRLAPLVQRSIDVGQEPPKGW